MDCISVLKQRGYNLEGYSPDTYYYLKYNDVINVNECEALLWLLEREYG